MISPFVLSVGYQSKHASTISRWPALFHSEWTFPFWEWVALSFSSASLLLLPHRFLRAVLTVGYLNTPTARWAQAQENIWFVFFLRSKYSQMFQVWRLHNNLWVVSRCSSTTRGWSRRHGSDGCLDIVIWWWSYGYGGGLDMVYKHWLWWWSCGDHGGHNMVMMVGLWLWWWSWLLI